MKTHDFIPLVTFRGWSYEVCRFVYGYYYIDSKTKKRVIQETFNEKYQIDKDSLGIYTGKDDKNGTPIFCGVAGANYGSDKYEDRVNYDRFVEFEVKYEFSGFGLTEINGGWHLGLINIDDCIRLPNQYEEFLKNLGKS